MFRSAADHQESRDVGAMHGLDSEEITEELKQRLKCQVYLEKKQIFKHRMGKAAVGKTLCPCLRCSKTSIYGEVSGIWYGLEFVLGVKRVNANKNREKASKHRWKGKFMDGHHLQRNVDVDMVRS